MSWRLAVGLPGSVRNAVGVGVVRAWDEFTDTDGTALESHAASDGGTWTKHSASGAGSATIDTNRVHNTPDATTHYYYHSWEPTSPNYRVEALMYLASDNNLSLSGIAARMDPSVLTMYFLRYATSANLWQLFKTVAGVSTQLGANSPPIVAVGQTVRAALDCQGSQITALVDGAVIISVTDSAISGPGRAGLRFMASESATTGMNIDEWRVLQ